LVKNQNEKLTALEMEGDVEGKSMMKDGSSVQRFDVVLQVVLVDQSLAQRGFCTL
jgi:hypothetical protein